MTARQDVAPASFERVTVFLTPESSAALARAVEAVGDSRTDTINRAIQTYALMVGEVADGARVLVQRTDQPTTRAQRSTAKLRSLLAGGTTTNAPEEGSHV